MKRLALLIGTTLVWPFAANADLNYNYIQADWIADGEVEIDGVPGDSDLDGIALEFSGDLSDFAPGFYAFGQTLSMEASDGPFASVSFDTLSLGLGLKGALMKQAGSQLDAFGTVSIEELDVGGDNMGYGLGAGLRWLAMPGLEIKPEVRWVDYGGGSIGAEVDGWRYGIDGVFNVSDKGALTLGWTTFKLEAEPGGGAADADIDMDNIIRVGGRLYF